MVLDGSGYIHAVYNDWFDTTLKYAYQDITGWHTQTNTGTVNPWRYKSIALDAEGYPHISFYAGYPAYRLDYAYLDASGWHIQTVDIG